MSVKYNIDGVLPMCPYCGAALSCDSAGNRDTETIGGMDVEYFICDNGCGKFSLVEDSLCDENLV